MKSENLQIRRFFAVLEITSWKSKNLISRLPKGMDFISFLSLFIAKDRDNFRRGCKCSLSFALKRDKKGIKAILFGSLTISVSVVQAEFE